MLYDNHRDATMRLVGTIICYDGKAQDVVDITQDLKVVCMGIKNNRIVEVDQEDPLLMLSPPPLGYLNTDSSSVYIMRSPARRWKQGIDTRVLVSKTRRIGPHLRKEWIADCLEGVYPSFGKAMDRFKGKNPFKPDRTTSVAFSRTFSVNREEVGTTIFYKDRKVGSLINNEPALDDKFIWLQESLEEALQ